MLCISVEIPNELCIIDDELKAIYHSTNSICIWVFKTRNDRNDFVNASAGMDKAAREDYYKKNYSFE